MRYLHGLILFLLSIPLFSQLPSSELLAEYNTTQLKALANSLNVIPNIIDYNYDVKVYKVIYATVDTQGQPTQASGALIVPSESNCNLALASYQHGTSTNRHGVPSRMSGEVNVGLLYATNGMVVCMPDYLGLGDSPGFHPYVHADSEATAVVDMLRSAHLLADELNYQLSEQLFLWGYSQGGHATAAVQKLIEEELSNEFTITASAPMAGPYDASGVQAEVITSNQPFPTPNYLPYILMAYQSVYGNLYNDLSEVFISPYDTLLPQLFDGIRTGDEIDAFLPDIPNQMIVPAVLDSFRNNPDHRFRVALRDNDLYDWRPASPTKLIYCRDDDQVNFQNSLVAYDAFQMNGAPAVEIQDIGGGLDHNDCAPFAFISGLVYFKQFLEVRNGIEIVSAVVEGSSGQNGSIVIEAIGGEGNLQYLWNTTAVGDSIGGLVAGDYMVSVTDEQGCFVEEEYTVEMLTGLATFEEAKSLKVYPNPAKSNFIVEWEGRGEEAWVQLKDIQGKRLQVWQVKGSSKLEVQQPLTPGMYLIELQQAQYRTVQKVVITN